MPKSNPFPFDLFSNCCTNAFPCNEPFQSNQIANEKSSFVYFSYVWGLRQGIILITGECKVFSNWKAERAGSSKEVLVCVFN